MAFVEQEVAKISKGEEDIEEDEELKGSCSSQHSSGGAVVFKRGCSRALGEGDDN